MCIIGVSAFGIVQAILIIAACVMLVAVVSLLYFDLQDYREKQIARRKRQAAERFQNLLRDYRRVIK